MLKIKEYFNVFQVKNTFKKHFTPQIQIHNREAMV